MLPCLFGTPRNAVLSNSQSDPFLILRSYMPVTPTPSFVSPGTPHYAPFCTPCALLFNTQKDQFSPFSIRQIYCFSFAHPKVFPFEGLNVKKYFNPVSEGLWAFQVNRRLLKSQVQLPQPSRTNVFFQYLNGENFAPYNLSQQ